MATKKDKPQEEKSATEETVRVEFNRSYRSYFPGDKAVFPAPVAEELLQGDENNPAIAEKVK